MSAYRVRAEELIEEARDISDVSDRYTLLRIAEILVRMEQNEWLKVIADKLGEIDEG